MFEVGGSLIWPPLYLLSAKGQPVDGPRVWIQVTAGKGGVTVQTAGGYWRGGGACLFPRWLLVFLMPCNITRNIVSNGRRKTFVILLLTYLDFNEHDCTCFACVSNTNCNELVYVNLIACLWEPHCLFLCTHLFLMCWCSFSFASLHEHLSTQLAAGIVLLWLPV